MEPKLKIQELTLSENILTIAIKFKCDLDIRVRSPKVTIIFFDGKNDRRLPVVLESVQATKDLKHCVVFSKYRYFINKIFIPFEPNDAITFRIGVTYGNTYYEDIPFTLSRDVDLNNDIFDVNINEEHTAVSFVRKEKRDQQRSGNIVTIVLGGIIKFVYKVVLYVLAAALIPLFIIDSVLAKLGLTPKSKHNHLHGIKWFLSHIRWRFASFVKHDISMKKTRTWYLKHTFSRFSHRKIKQNRVTFLSSRRADMTGNLAFVYDRIKREPNMDIQVLLDPVPLSKMSFRHIRQLSYLCATSKVLLIDDFFPTLNYFTFRDQTKLIQLWHACGAFKTFGFSRLGKRGGPTQASKNHRNYDYAVVSSEEISKYYAEGFGVPINHIAATGVPRTDIFFDEIYKNKVVDEFYSQYPQLKDKKIILFAPTFRGNGKESANYPPNRFDPEKLYKETNGEYAVLIKHHPFVHNEIQIDEQYKDYIIDMSEQSEINDLLFVTDILITDYSSVVFEASLLNIPMLFYAYDLNRYIATRDFYCEYELFVPGKIVQSQAALISAINDKDFEEEKIDPFKKQFFDHLDGKSTERVVKLIDSIIKE